MNAEGGPGQMEKEKLYVIKIGGNIIDDAGKLESFIKNYAAIAGNKVLVHGGGKIATAIGERMQIAQQVVDGRRVTDAETLKLVTMVYAGLINKQLVSALQAMGCNAFGFTGADGDFIRAHKRTGSAVDYGFAGDIDMVNSGLLTALLKTGLSPVIAPITHDGNGQLLNTNADTIVQSIATGMAGNYEVSLVYLFEKKGVLENVEDPSSLIDEINEVSYHQLKSRGAIVAGMLPKLDNAFAAIKAGVKNVCIGEASDLDSIIHGKAGTRIIA